MKPPVYVEQLPAKQVNNQPNAGSLFGRGDNPLFADRKAMNVNDIVTVVISERANQSSSGKHDTSKNSTISLGGGIFTAGSAPLSTLATQLNKAGDIGFSAGNKNEFTGAGSSVRAEAFTTTISARIIKVLENGNYDDVYNLDLLLALAYRIDSSAARQLRKKAAGSLCRKPETSIIFCLDTACVN